jgi:hypothetical protein
MRHSTPSFLPRKSIDNQSKFVERIERLRKTAFGLKDAAEIVLAGVQHMEAAAAPFKARVGKSTAQSGRAN